MRIGYVTKDYTPIIKKENLKHGVYYAGTCRNANVARWNETKQLFFHWRTKFNNKFVEEIHCPEDDDFFDVFVAERELLLTEITEEIPF